MKQGAAPRDRFVVAHPERKAQRTLQRLVGATLCPVEVVADVDALLAAIVRWATDARYLAIEVRDNWGSIDIAEVTRALAAGGNRVGEQDEGGMGLPLAYACSHCMAINCAPREVTEVITLLDVRHKPTELARAASFHAFMHPC